jgi:hypothetical protein
MSCLSCHLPIINTAGHIGAKDQYVKLFRKLFPKKPIEFNYCTSCYQFMVRELEAEYNSQLEHLNSYNTELGTLKKQTNQTYSITDDKSTQRYVILSESSEEYKNIQKHFQETLSFKIIRIEKNNNSLLMSKFNERSKQLSCQNIKYLFHGSNDKAYDSILETGFDMDYASPHGLLGKGIYYAVKSNYSHGYGRMTKTNIGKINHLLYCKVNLGKTCKGQSGLMETPKGFDAVHSDYDTYCVFNNFQGFPEYIIYYLVEDSKT